MTERWTVQRVIQWVTTDLTGRGVDTARLDAELLVAHALGTNRVGLYIDLHRPLQPAELAAIRALVARRREREPVAYIVGYREFYGRRFEVDRSVLIPRPETETLVDAAIVRIDSRAADSAEGVPQRVLDLCCGSGAIGVSIAAERTSVVVSLLDISNAALDITRRNAEALGVAERVTLIQGSVLDAVALEAAAGGAYDLIVCNPPYIPVSECRALAPEIVRYEPILALEAGADGLDFYRALAKTARALLAPSGALLLEVGADQSRPVAALFEAAAWHIDGFTHDYHSIERVVAATPTNTSA